ncbi:hypothetical protein PPYR_04613 [Photinus pyralis]|uniref:Uncharacterized protein n=2 Tax=Photinus pyralis TaxID=7054 RepID=A0A5N4AYK1_PHOPY|nr:hypothetical protein PPYR_04613 [Photinus pyralis]
MIECNDSRRCLEAKKNVSYQKSRSNKGFSLLNIFSDVPPEQNESSQSLCPLRLNYEVYNLKPSQSLIGIVCCGNERCGTKKKLHVSIAENVLNKNRSPMLLLLNQNSDKGQAILKGEESTTVDDYEEPVFYEDKKWTDAAVSNAEFEKDLQVSLHSSSEYITYTSDRHKSITEEHKTNYSPLPISKVQKVGHRLKSHSCKNCARKNYQNFMKNCEKQNSLKTASEMKHANFGYNQKQTVVYHSAVINDESSSKDKEDRVDFNEFLEKIAKSQKNASMLSNIDDLNKRINHLDKLLNDTIIRTYTDRLLKDRSFTPVKRKKCKEKNICHFSTLKQQEAIYNTIFKHKPTVMRPLKEDVGQKNYYYDQLLPVSINLAQMNFTAGPITSVDAPNYYYGQLSTSARVTVNNARRRPSRSDSSSDSSELSSETSSSESVTETSSESPSECESSCCSHSSCDCKDPIAAVLIKSSSEVNLRTGAVKTHLKVLLDRGHSSRSIEIRG